MTNQQIQNMTFAEVVSAYSKLIERNKFFGSSQPTPCLNDGSPVPGGHTGRVYLTRKNYCLTTGGEVMAETVVYSWSEGTISKTELEATNEVPMPAQKTLRQLYTLKVLRN